MRDQHGGRPSTQSRRAPERARRAQRGRLLERDVDVPAGQGGHQLVGMVVGVDRRTGDVGCHPLQGQVQQGAVAHRAQRLGPYVGQRPEPACRHRRRAPRRPARLASPGHALTQGIAGPDGHVVDGMPAVTVDDVLSLPRIPAADLAAVRPAGPLGHHRAARLRGRGLPGAPRLRRRRPRRPRPVRAPRPDGRGGVRAGRAQGHAVAPAPRLRDRHLHDRRGDGPPGLQRRRRPDHQRRHPVDDRRVRDPAHRDAARGAGR